MNNTNLSIYYQKGFQEYRNLYNQEVEKFKRYKDEAEEVILQKNKRIMALEKAVDEKE